MAEKELLNAISEMMDEKLSGLKEDVTELREDVTELRENVTELREDVMGLKENVSSLKNEMDELRADVNMLKDDNGHIWTELTSIKGEIADLRGAQVETNAKLDLMDAEVRGMRTHLENVTDLKIKLVAENIFPATSQYISATKEIGKLREGVDVLNRVVRNHSERIRRNEEKLQMA